MAALEARERIAPLWGYLGLSAALACALLYGLGSGDVEMSLRDVLRVLMAGPKAQTEEAFKLTVIWQIRLPRAAASAIAGAVLAGCGVVFQGALRNPLAEPYTLGIASGGAFGAACAIVAGLPWVTAAAFAGGVSALLLVWILGQRAGEADAARVILAGVIIGSILGAGLTVIKALAGDKVSLIVLWLMGSFSAASSSDILPLALSLAILLLLSLAGAKELDIMASGAPGDALGLDVPRARLLLLTGASLAVSFVVSRFGVIGFVGLVIPHLLRVLFGPPHARLLPLSMLGGAALLCGADTFAKGWNELPVGVLTVLIGGPVFCLLLWNRR